MTSQSANPLAAMLSFPEAFILAHRDIVPSDSGGWGLDLFLSMPRMIAYEYVRSQMAMAGFKDESNRSNASLFRFFRDDALVWGVVEDTGGGSRVFLSKSPEPQEPDEA